MIIMKKILISLLLTGSMCLVTFQPAQADPITLVITTVVKKVLKALDLAVQRLQNATIKLQNAQKALENVMSKLNLDEIFEWTEKQRQLFSGYYDELWKIKSMISTFKRTKDIIENQYRVIAEYRRAVALFQGDNFYKPEQLEDMMEVYLGILDASVKNIEKLTTVINAFATQMGDARRLEIISEVDDNVQTNLNDIRSFTNQHVMYRLQKAKDDHELKSLRAYYGIQEPK